MNAKECWIRKPQAIELFPGQSPQAMSLGHCAVSTSLGTDLRGLFKQPCRAVSECNMSTYHTDAGIKTCTLWKAFGLEVHGWVFPVFSDD